MKSLTVRYSNKKTSAKGPVYYWYYEVEKYTATTFMLSHNLNNSDSPRALVPVLKDKRV